MLLYSITAATTAATSAETRVCCYYFVSCCLCRYHDPRWLTSLHRWILAKPCLRYFLSHDMYNMYCCTFIKFLSQDVDELLLVYRTDKT